MNNDAHDGQRNMATPLDTLIGLLPNPCALITREGVIRAINPAWRDAFFHTGLGEKVLDVCGGMFQWEHAEQDYVQAEIAALLAGETLSCHFEDMLAEPPERWFANTIVVHEHLNSELLWQAHDVSAWRIAELETARIWHQIRDALESISDGFAIYDTNDRLVFFNQHYRNLYDRSTDFFVIGTTFEEIVRGGVMHGQYPDAVGREEAWIAERVRQHQECETVELRLSDGIWLRSMDKRTSDGGIVCIRTDITVLKQSAALREQSEQQAELIRIQSSLLAELSTPLLRISERVVVMPLIGSLDSARASLVVDSLLRTIEDQRVEVAILDITGVPVVDTQIANVLIQCARAVKLLGAATVLTGIRPDVAQTMVALGIDLEGIVTRADLMGGIAYALRRK
ncbi:Sulfate transporter/antisigma-factor antagonist STAS [Oscillochloris trichoides DG-6]|uniref:Sulfate transporter/antisigma-factor antagonist STAS n=1 Tax=Oscillochloris trichoides DG-6 TaxID=765420 RepID=E1IBE4_9CHLR|nr:PAS-domain containing protein [Oscillochloris trichoides]EFO81501.1 Sulfate transporter/antisigma-factor antagonist STAS [Oscillochloris trichoides DG-6]